MGEIRLKKIYAEMSQHCATKFQKIPRTSQLLDWSGPGAFLSWKYRSSIKSTTIFSLKTTLNNCSLSSWPNNIFFLSFNHLQFFSSLTCVSLMTPSLADMTKKLLIGNEKKTPFHISYYIQFIKLFLSSPWGPNKSKYRNKHRLQKLFKLSLFIKLLFAKQKL